MSEILALILIAVLVIIVVRGTIVVFSNSFWLALLMLFALPPLLLIWIIFEGIFY